MNVLRRIEAAVRRDRDVVKMVLDSGLTDTWVERNESGTAVRKAGRFMMCLDGRVDKRGRWSRRGIGIAQLALH